MRTAFKPVIEKKGMIAPIVGIGKSDGYKHDSVTFGCGYETASARSCISRFHAERIVVHFEKPVVIEKMARVFSASDVLSVGGNDGTENGRRKRRRCQTRKVICACIVILGIESVRI